jgi:hypothetical protein
MRGARRVPGAGTSRSDSKSPVLSVTNLCADQFRNRGPVVLPHSIQFPDSAGFAPRHPPARHTPPTAVGRIEKEHAGLDDRFGAGKSQLATTAKGLLETASPTPSCPPHATGIWPHLRRHRCPRPGMGCSSGTRTTCRCPLGYTRLPRRAARRWKPAWPPRSGPRPCS